MSRFSVCIPNYNYARYLGETIGSVLTQGHADMEICVSDNASTDGSVAVVEAIDDPRIRVQVNPTNVGFAPNVERAAQMATGDTMILLSSDDLVRPDALATYDQLIDACGTSRTVICADVDVIDSDGRTTGRIGADPDVWASARRSPQLSGLVGADVIEVDPHRLLRQCLLHMRTPFNFSATAYPSAAHDEVGGYIGGRLYNPDKWFHWRLLTAVDRVLFVRRPLFGYRWHDANQVSLERSTGALKFLVDDYVNSFEVSDQLLSFAALDRGDVVGAFIEHDVARHGLATLARGDVARARRIAHLGRATYPEQYGRNPKALALSVLATAGPLGRRVAAVGHRRMTDGT